MTTPTYTPGKQPHTMNLNAQHRPISEIEAAHEAAEALLADHKDILPAGLATLLATFESDLTVIIEDHYGISPDDNPGTGEPETRA